MAVTRHPVFLTVEIAVVCNELWKVLEIKCFEVFCKDVTILYNKTQFASLKQRNKENMSKSVLDRINYFVALITEFATLHHISTSEAYEYLKEYKGLDFVDRFYDVEHTFSFENTVEDLTRYCQRMGGSLV